MRHFECEELYCVANEDGEIGRGGFGVVLFAFHATYDVVAIKCFEVPGGYRKAKLLEKKLNNEFGILQSINHDNIVRVFGWSHWRNTAAIVIEYLPGGNLMELVVSVDLDPLLQLRICMEVANGLAYIHNMFHQNRIIHGDIKPENVLLTEDLHCKISDFGSSKVSSYTGGMTTSKSMSQQQSEYTELYAAPECLSNAMLTLKPSYDTYSFSVVVYVVLRRQLPLSSFALWESYKTGLIAGQRPDLEDIMESKQYLEENNQLDEIKALDILIDVMVDCWQQNPSDRPTMLEVKEKLHDVLNEIPSSKILQSVAMAVEEMEILKPVRKDYECVPLNEIQLFNQQNQPSNSATSSNPASLIGSSSISITPSPLHKSSAEKLKISSKDFSATADGTSSGSASETPSLSISKGKGVRYVALYDYRSVSYDDLSFQKGELLIVPDAFRWFFGNISRKDSETLLMYQKNQRGTFLILKNNDFPNPYSLSVLDEGDKNSRVVKHYRIQTSKGRFYISLRRQFESVQKLVEYYKTSAEDLCCLLLQPCPLTKALSHLKSLASQKDVWETGRNGITLNKKISDWRFGEVWKGTWGRDVEVAIKIFKPGTKASADFHHEAEIMKALRHEKLLYLYGVISSEPMYIITEYMSHGSLLKYLKDGPGKTTSLMDHINMLLQIASGMAYMERMEYIHKDLRAANILVGENQTCKVANFSLAKSITDDVYTAGKDENVPIKWAAPEAAQYGRFTVKSDVWSFGILFTEVITKGKSPYPDMNNEEVFEVLDKGYRMPKSLLAKSDSDCPDALYVIMLRCWSSEAEDRPTFQFIQEFLEDYSQTDDPSAYQTSVEEVEQQ